MLQRNENKTATTTLEQQNQNQQSQQQQYQIQQQQNQQQQQQKQQQQQHYINGNNYPQNIQNHSVLSTGTGSTTARVTALLNSASTTGDQQQVGNKPLMASTTLKYQPSTQQQQFQSSNTLTLHRK